MPNDVVLEEEFAQVARFFDPEIVQAARDLYHSAAMSFREYRRANPGASPEEYAVALAVANDSIPDLGAWNAMSLVYLMACLAREDLPEVLAAHEIQLRTGPDHAIELVGRKSGADELAAINRGGYTVLRRGAPEWGEYTHIIRTPDGKHYLASLG